MSERFYEKKINQLLWPEIFAQNFSPDVLFSLLGFFDSNDDDDAA